MVKRELNRSFTQTTLLVKLTDRGSIQIPSVTSADLKWGIKPGKIVLRKG